MTSASVDTSLRFGRCELQPAKRRLLIDGKPVPLRGRAFDLLLVLAQRAGSLVTKAELLELVWPGIFVEEGNLAVQISSLRKLLGGEIIATVPGRGYHFTAPVERAAPAAVEVDGQAPAQLPPVPPTLVGREDELAWLKQALQRASCVTLTGPPGIGKTTLARTLGARWPSGCVWVDLAPLTGAGQVESALARALSRPLPDADVPATLATAIAGRLLVLDNAEHLLDAIAALAAALISQDPGLRMVCTSQAPLAIADEQVIRLDPLALPIDDDELDPRRGAMALLIERVRTAQHGFEATPAALPVLRDICYRLDGLPLALEMAAARVPALGLTGVQEAVAHRFALLTTGRRNAATRHRTLVAALDWSYNLLGADERRLLRALGVFADGFTLDLGVAVAGEYGVDRWATVDRVALLVDRSLVAADARDPPRYRLLETIRVYALEQLQQAGEADTVRARLARALLDLYRKAQEDVRDEHARAAALNEHDNVREAIAWALKHDAALAVNLAVRVAAVSIFSSWRRQAARWLDDCAPVIEHPDIPPPLLAAWWHERARQTLMDHDARARDMAAMARALYRELQDDRGAFNATSAMVRGSQHPCEDLPALCDEMQVLLDRHPEWPPNVSLLLIGTRAHVASLQQDWQALLDHRLAELALAQRVSSSAMIDAVETNVMVALLRLGRHDEVIARGRTLLARLSGSDSINAAYAWETLCTALLQTGRFEELRAAARLALPILRRHAMPAVLAVLALMLARERRPDDAARLIGHLQSRQALDGATRLGKQELEEAQALVRNALDPDVYERRLGEGRTLEEAAAAEPALAAAPRP